MINCLSYHRFGSFREDQEISIKFNINVNLIEISPVGRNDNY